MGQLQADEEVVVAPQAVAWAGRQMPDELLERRGVARVDDELAGVGAALGDDGGGLAPDQLGTAGPNRW